VLSQEYPSFARFFEIPRSRKIQFLNGLSANETLANCSARKTDNKSTAIRFGLKKIPEIAIDPMEESAGTGISERPPCGNGRQIACVSRVNINGPLDEDYRLEGLLPPRSNSLEESTAFLKNRGLNPKSFIINNQIPSD
jgi:hypothetical protein